MTWLWNDETTDRLTAAADRRARSAPRRSTRTSGTATRVGAGSRWATSVRTSSGWRWWLIVAAAFVLALVLGMTADWWDPFTH